MYTGKEGWESGEEIREEIRKTDSVEIRARVLAVAEEEKDPVTTEAAAEDFKEGRKIEEIATEKKETEDDGNKEKEIKITAEEKKKEVSSKEKEREEDSSEEKEREEASSEEKEREEVSSEEEERVAFSSEEKERADLSSEEGRKRVTLFKFFSFCSEVKGRKLSFFLFTFSNLYHTPWFGMQILYFSHISFLVQSLSFWAL